MVESSKALPGWRQDIITLARYSAARVDWVAPASVWVGATFVFVRPKSVSVAKRPTHNVRPDLDKLQRALGDALTIAQVIRDDASIVGWNALKYYGPLPGVRVILTNAE